MAKSYESKVYDLDFIIEAGKIDFRVDGIVVCLNFELISWLIRIWFFFQCHHSLSWIVFDVNYVSSCKGKWFELAVELFFVTAPWIPIRTDHVISMARIWVLKQIIYFLYLVDMAYPDPDPWGQFNDSDSPLLDCHCFYVKYHLLDKQGSRIRSLSLEEVYILAW